jgi:hypothetical protein
MYELKLVAAATAIYFLASCAGEAPTDLGHIENTGKADRFGIFEVGNLEPGDSKEFTFTLGGDVQLRLEQRLRSQEHPWVGIWLYNADGEEVGSVGELAIGPEGTIEGVAPADRPMVVVRGVPSGENQYTLEIKNQSADRLVEDAKIHVERPFDGACEAYLTEFFDFGRGEIYAQCDVLEDGLIDDPMVEITGGSLCVASLGFQGGMLFGSFDYRFRKDGYEGTAEGRLITAANNLSQSKYESSDNRQYGEDGDSGWMFETQDGRKVKRTYEYLRDQNTLVITRESKWPFNPFGWRNDHRARFSCEPLDSNPGL